MATGGITTLPSTPEDGGSSGFPPGSFKDPKRLYCKNGGFFLRIKSDGVVDGIREKNDPHSKPSPVSSSPQCSFMLLSECSREAKTWRSDETFPVCCVNAPLVSLRRAAGGKFNGRFRRNAPLSFMINGKCDEMCLVFQWQPFRPKTFLLSYRPSRSSIAVLTNLQ